MGEQAKPSGPDLARGIPVANVKPGGSVSGQVNGEAVLLVQMEDEWLAIGATCSHYGGPLGEGLVVGDTVRCPWHHACFNLRTGEPIAAPATFPIARYRVEREGNRFRIAEKLPDAEVPKGARGPRSVAIVGAGAAGFAAAEMLRRHGYEGSLTLVDPDPDASSDRP